MFCIYETNEKDAFPLELQNTNLFYEPAPFKDGSWAKIKKMTMSTTAFQLMSQITLYFHGFQKRIIIQIIHFLKI